MTRPATTRGPWLAWGATLALLAAGIAAVAQLNGYYVFVIATIALLAITGIGLNILLGLTGQVSLGHVGFYAIGAYAMSLLTTQAGWSFWLAWPLAAVLAAALGALLALPALRAKGPYLAMITIAFGFVVENGIVEWRSLTGGQNGIMGIAPPALFGPWRGERAVAAIAIVATGVALVVYALLSRGTWGAAMRAVRDSEAAAESIGLRPIAIKCTAFALSAAFAGAAGGLFAPLAGMVTPHTFGFVQSILFVLVVMIGGVGSVFGPLVGALIVGALPEVLANFEDLRLLVFGALLLVVLWVAPDGVVGTVRRAAAWWCDRRMDASTGERAAVATTTPATPATPDTSAPAPTLSAAFAARSRGSLVVDGLVRQFGGLRAVDGLAMTVPAGQVTALIGPNGAGKTTALNLLSGYDRATSGRHALTATGTEAEPLDGRPAWRIARAGVARTWQTSQLFGSLSTLDNVALALARGRLGPLLGAARLRAPAVRERATTLLRYTGHADGAHDGALDAPAAGLAHVDRRLVEIARAGARPRRAAARRAGRRPVARRQGAARTASRAHRRERHRRAAGRARHAARDGGFAAGGGARCRPAHRRRHAGRGAGRPGRAPRLPR